MISVSNSAKRKKRERLNKTSVLSASSKATEHECSEQASRLFISSSQFCGQCGMSHLIRSENNVKFEPNIVLLNPVSVIETAVFEIN